MWLEVTGASKRITGVMVELSVLLLLTWTHMLTDAHQWRHPHV